jgi:hypothetical protein
MVSASLDICDDRFGEDGRIFGGESSIIGIGATI